jgi:hypothetical protein
LDALRGTPLAADAGVTAADAFAALYADPAGLREFANLMNAISVRRAG